MILWCMCPIHQEIKLIVEPYTANLISYFIGSCLTLLIIVLMYTFYHWIFSFCRETLNVDPPLAAKVLIVMDELFILWHFMIFLYGKV